MITACMPCEDFTLKAGPTKVIPKSHLHKRQPYENEVKGEDGAIPILCKKGSLVFWLGSTWHGNYPRLKKGKRVVLHISFSRLMMRPIENYDHLNDSWLKGKPKSIRTMLGRDDFLELQLNLVAELIEARQLKHSIDLIPKIMEISTQNNLDLRYSWYFLSIMTLSFAVSFIDRQVMTLLIEPIKSDLLINDTQVSLLIGFAFSIFYISMAIPIARLVDRGNRVNIISLGVFFWSLMTAVCGLAKNYWQLFLARVGVGVGEATLTPAVYSLIPDYFPKEKLGTAVGFYMLGMSFGTGFALVLGGAILSYVSNIGDIVFPIVGTLRPWQVTFVIVGLPGIFLALLIKLSIREPVRRNIFDNDNSSIDKISNFFS